MTRAGNGTKSQLPVLRDVERDHVGAAALHLDGEEAAGGSDLQDALAGKVHVSEVVIDAAAQVPRAGRRDAFRQVGHVVVR